MGHLAVLSQLPPARSDSAMAGAALVRVLRGAGHEITAPWPLPESVEALLGLADLTVYHVSNDVEDREVYELALDRPGLVVLHDLALDRLVRGLMRVQDPVGIDSAREALEVFDRLAGLEVRGELRAPWCARLVRRARGVVVHSSFAGEYLAALGTRTPVFVVPPAAFADRRSLRGARRRGTRLRRGLGRGPVLGVVGVDPAMGMDVALGAARGGHVVSFDPSAGTEEAPPRGIVSAFGLPEGEMVAWIAACDAVVDLRDATSTAIPTSLVRAVQLGTPVVAATRASIPSGLEGAVTLLQGSPADPQEVAAAVEARPERGRAGGVPLDRVGAAAAAGHRDAVARTLDLVLDPVRWTLERWAGALLDSGVTEGGVRAGYGTAYTEALEELRPT